MKVKSSEEAIFATEVGSEGGGRGMLNLGDD